MKIDLDELERKARLATSGQPGGDLWRWRIADVHPSDADVLEQDGDGAQVVLAVADILGDVALICSVPDRAHIAANSPPVTLALVARIRELEAFLAEARGGDGECGGLPHFLREDVDALLEKGATIA